MICLSVSVCDIFPEKTAVRANHRSPLSPDFGNNFSLYEKNFIRSMFKLLALATVLVAHAALSMPTSDTKPDVTRSEDVIDLQPVLMEAFASPDGGSLESNLRSLIATRKQMRPPVRPFSSYRDVGAPSSGYKRISSSSSSFVPWAGKRALQTGDKRFQAWAGKRGDKSFRSWSGKRSEDTDYLI